MEGGGLCNVTLNSNLYSYNTPYVCKLGTVMDFLYIETVLSKYLSYDLHCSTKTITYYSVSFFL